MPFFRKKQKTLTVRINESDLTDSNITDTVKSAYASGYSSITIEFERTGSCSVSTTPLTECSTSNASLTCVINNNSATVPVNENNEYIFNENDYIAYISDTSGKIITRIYNFPFTTEKIPGILFEEIPDCSSFSCIISNQNACNLTVEDEPVHKSSKISMFSGCSFSVSGTEYLFYIKN